MVDEFRVFAFVENMKLEDILVLTKEKYNTQKILLQKNMNYKVEKNKFVNV